MRTLKITLTLVVLLCTFASLQAQINVISATWAHGDRTADVTTRVQELADSGEPQFEVRNHILGADPAAGVSKTLTVVYTVNGGEQITVSKAERQYFEWPALETIITCEGNEFKVGDDKKIYEKRDGNWVHVGDRCEELTCNRRRVFCVSTDGSLWRYNGEPHNWTPANTLLAGQDLNGGTVMGGAHFLASANGNFFFYMQENGDLGIWEHTPSPVNRWSSRTSPSDNATLHMQDDGNLVAYKADGSPLWASMTHPSENQRYLDNEYKPVRLVLEDDGKIVLYSATNRAVWNNVDGHLE